jgi:hypothetical protein
VERSSSWAFAGCRYESSVRRKGRGYHGRRRRAPKSAGDSKVTPISGRH